MSNNGARDKTIDVGGVAVHIRELTVGDIGEWMQTRLNPNLDTVQDPLPALLPVGDMRLADILHMTDLTLDKAKPMTGSQLETLLERCREVNQSFFDLASILIMGDQLQALQNELDQALKSSSKTSTETAPP